MVAVGGVTLGDVTDVGVGAEDFLQNDQTAARLPGRLLLLEASKRKPSAAVSVGKRSARRRHGAPGVLQAFALQEFRHQEGQLKRLIGVQPRIAVGVVAVG